MCTLVLIHRLLPSAPLVVLANRDEMTDRPARAPAVVHLNPVVFCGQDAKEGGTWCGVNEHGLFVGLTNLTVRPPDGSRRSRGLLCLEMLYRRDASEVRTELAALDEDVYNAFNLVVSDGVLAYRIRYDRVPEIEELGPGVHGTTNWPRDSEGDLKRSWSEAQVARAVQSSTDLTALTTGLQAIARTHERDADPRASICCHVPGYGTRSSSVIAVLANGQTVYQHSDGPPCESRFDDLSQQAQAAFGQRSASGD